jgi:uncharacterized protein DUF4240
MEYDHQTGRIKGFELKFKRLDKDIERYMFALLDLLEAGKIELTPLVKSLVASQFWDDGLDWILNSYFERGLFDQLEGHFTPTGDVFFPPSATARKYMDRMLERGESARVRRIWRAYIGLARSRYWQFVHDRDKFEPDANLPVEEDWREKLAGRVLELKERTLAGLADYRAVLVSTGAATAELARVDADIAAVDAEERPTPKGKADNRPMTEDVFWELIDHGLGHQSIGERLETLPDRLALFKPAEIRKFDQILRELDNAVYRTDIWALAYLLRGGCSDDSFDDFRGWLILQGRKVFKSTLAEPDNFEVALYRGESGGMNALLDAAPTAYEMRDGKSMKPVRAPLRELKGPAMNEEEFASYLPKIAAAMRLAAEP